MGLAAEASVPIQGSFNLMRARGSVDGNLSHEERDLTWSRVLETENCCSYDTVRPRSRRPAGIEVVAGIESELQRRTA